MFELFLGTDVVRRKIGASVDPALPAKTPRRRRTVLRSTTAAALRGLADLLEPAHGAPSRSPSTLVAQRKI
jgi:hypothetical protein